jgi:hypothetical protein
MFLQGTQQQTQSPVRVVQTPSGRFFGVINDPQGRETFGPYAELDELLAVMSDWLTQAIREASVEQLS